MDIEDKKIHTDKWFTYLQVQICKEFEKLELNRNTPHAIITSVNLFLIMRLIFISFSFLIQISTTN